MDHPYLQRYRDVWQQMLAQGYLPAEQIEKSRYYFEPDLTAPTPRVFSPSTYGIAALLPMPVAIQAVFTGLWDEIMTSLGQPLAYAVEPQNRHVELLLFSRPEETVPDDIIQRNVELSFQAISTKPPGPFSVTFCRPFITPDGTVVAPGLPNPATTIDNLRTQVRQATGGTLPQKQSQWFHTSLGRILEPIDHDRLRSTLDTMELHWGKAVASLDIDELLWTSEQQWYMLQKQILHRLTLAA